MSNISFDEMLNKITSNQELMKKISTIVSNNEGGEITDTLPDILSLIASNEGEKDKSDNTEENSHFDTGDTREKNDVTSIISSLGTEISNSSPLLLAIKPDLNKNRQNMIDTLIKLSSLAKVINLGRL